jgi:eukaryotic-like serine/threonine-protein kinase
MELVRGQPITEFCDEAQLAPRERLKLFVDVCQAVQHAHQKGIIHRDLKPTNVLVSIHDGQPAIKVIDFGIAKATGGTLTDKTFFTGFAQMIGTPLYMSPEQAGQSPDVDTRSDVYSLGVLLYELLTGTTPFDKQRFRDAAYDEIRRIIREEEPPKPSTRLSHSKDALPSISAQRQMEPARLTKLVRGQLDWIVMKALEKDRNRRYATANSLALDVQHYLQDEAVEACPPSARYRLSKFAKRNKVALITSALVATALVAGVVVSDWQAIRATQAEKIASTQSFIAQQNADRVSVQEQVARQEAENARAAERLARQHLYASQMNLAAQAWDRGRPDVAVELLKSYIPGGQGDDLRGFEWYYHWRMSHQRLRNTLRGHQAAVRALSFSRDSKLVISASQDGVFAKCEADTGRQLTVLRLGGGNNSTVALSPDNKTLVTGSSDGAVRILAHCQRTRCTRTRKQLTDVGWTKRRNFSVKQRTW